MSSARGGDQYQIVGQIGEGVRVGVLRARSAEPRLRHQVVQSNPKDPPVVPAPTIREVHLLTELSHENVLNLLHVQVNHAELALSLVFDYADDLDIIGRHKDAKRGKPIPQRMVKSIAWQMLNGLAYLHENDVMHRDLKPQNILIMGDGVEHGVVKIADFGLARRCRSPARPLIDGPVVTLWYRAPELLLGAESIISWRWTSGPWARSWRAPHSFPAVPRRREKSRDMYDRSQLGEYSPCWDRQRKRTGLICPRILSGPRRRRRSCISPQSPVCLQSTRRRKQASLVRALCHTIRSSVRRRSESLRPRGSWHNPCRRGIRSIRGVRSESYPQRQIKPHAAR